MRTDERDRALFRVFTGLLAVLMVGSAGRALFDYPWAQESFVHLGYPTYIIYPLEIAKLLGVAAILSNRSPFLKNLAYAGVLLPPASRPERARGRRRRTGDDDRVGFGVGVVGRFVPFPPPERTERRGLMADRHSCRKGCTVAFSP